MELPSPSWRLGVMSYIDETLADNERLIYRARFHWLHKIEAWITLAIFFVLAAICLTWAPGSWAWLAAGAFALFGAAAFVALMLPIWTTEIGVTSQRLISKRGWLRRKTDELQLASIEEVNLDQGAMGRLLDFGRLRIHGTGVNDISLPTLADPVGLRRSLQEAMGTADAVVVTSEPKPITSQGTEAA
jgi:uncharacterized membrane protein YdbT with pleckstrin-like domain